MTDFKERVYKGKNDTLYNEILDETMHLLKENPMGLAILKGANYKDVVSKEEFDRAEADMKSGTTPGFAVDEVYIGYFDRDKGSPTGGRCTMVVPNDGDKTRENARGEVYLASQYMEDLILSLGKNDASQYLTNILAHEFTHANQFTHLISEISDSSSRLETDGKMQQRGGGHIKDENDNKINMGWEGTLLTEANSDTAGLIILKDTGEKSQQLIDYYQADIKKHGWISDKASEYFKDVLTGKTNATATDIFHQYLKEKVNYLGPRMCLPLDFTGKEKWVEACYQPHLFGEDKGAFINNTMKFLKETTDEYMKSMRDNMQNSAWLNAIHPRPRDEINNPNYHDKTNAEFLFDQFYDRAQGKDETKIPTDEEIKAQADAYFKEFGIEGFADTFIQAYPSTANSKIKEYTSLIKHNIKSLSLLKENTACTQNEDGAWTLEINEKADLNGHHVVETRAVHIKKELADEIFALHLENEMKNEATYHLYEAEYQKEHPEFDYQTADKNEKNTFKRDAIDWYTKNMESYYHLYEEEYRKEHPDFNYDTANKEEKTAFKKEAVEWAKKDANSPISKTEAYVGAHRDELIKPMQEKLLKEKVLEQVVANYATFRTIENTGHSAYQSKNDIGHCSKSVLTYMYQLQAQNGGYAFLPEDPNVAAQPEKLFEHFNENWPQRTEQTNDIAESFKNHQPPYEEGTLALIDNNHGRHLMMYRGLNENGEPEFIGFNPATERQVLINQKMGEIIDIPSLIRDETRGVLEPAKKQITAENLQESERGIIAVDMSITRTADGEQIQGFEGKIEIPNPIQYKSQKEHQHSKENEAVAQTILEKTGRPSAKRKMPRVKTETKKELKKLGFWNMFKKSKERIS